jgi:hypothetical protein
MKRITIFQEKRKKKKKKEKKKKEKKRKEKKKKKKKKKWRVTLPQTEAKLASNCSLSCILSGFC